MAPNSDLEELRRCSTRLAELKAEIDAILAIFGKDIILTGERKLLAQERLKKFKGRLRSEFDAGEHGLNRVDRMFYFRAVHAALASIYVRYNSRPDQKWIDQLLTARSSIDLAASRVNE